MKRTLAAVAALATVLAHAPVRADDARKPEVAVAVLVDAGEGVKLVEARKATIAISMERALRRDPRLLVVDQDDRLAAKNDVIPTEPVSEARGLLSTGRTMLQRGQAKAAVLKLQGAVTQLARVLAWTQKQDLAEAQLYLGTAQAIAGDSKGAIATFAALLVWRPDALPDPDLSPSVVMPIWGKAQDLVANRGTGSVDIGSTPDGALAYVDGNLAGFTPTVVDGLTEGTHYVTLRHGGFVRRVDPVAITAGNTAPVEVKLEPSKRGDELADAAALLSGRLGGPIAKAEAQAGLAAIGELLGVEQVVVVLALPGDGQYRTYVYATDGGARLGATDVTVGDRDPEEAFAEAGTELYAQVARAKVKPKVAVVKRASGPRGTPIYKKRWFWIGVGGVVAAGVATAVIVNTAGGDDGPTCPGGQSCGTVVFRY